MALHIPVRVSKLLIRWLLARRTFQVWFVGAHTIAARPGIRDSPSGDESDLAETAPRG